MACGRMDQELAGRAFWAGAFGNAPTERQLTDWHPLRRMEQAKPTPEEQKASTGFAFAVLERGLAELNRQKRKEK